VTAGLRDTATSSSRHNPGAATAAPTASRHRPADGSWRPTCRYTGPFTTVAAPRMLINHPAVRRTDRTRWGGLPHPPKVHRRGQSEGHPGGGRQRPPKVSRPVTRTRRFCGPVHTWSWTDSSLRPRAVGARKVYLYVHRRSKLEARLEVALAQRDAARHRSFVGHPGRRPAPLPGRRGLGPDQQGRGRACPASFRPTADLRARCQRSADPGPETSRPWPHIALISRHGASWFREVGTGAEPAA